MAAHGGEMGKMRKWSKALRGAVAVSAFTLVAVSASAEDLLVENSPNAEATLNVLMQPISPFMLGHTQSTTSIAQIGDTNHAISNVNGASNLSSINQTGSNNRAVQSIEGSNSALLLVQGGTNNNVLQASQGDRNFQLVGVSGNNNSVAYLQKGSDLAGALDVTNASNATVLAIQTPQSDHYLMPTGLRGLQNAVVVIVPGRMYVIPKK
ncbi:MULTISPECIES: hypothetical protein [unclassified Mesorhizobium]|uniref:hypothetical protein n=1 Tax=unclassified Mesorhizobium TaxID=325217 RepID=UPI0011295203|nr:MULTISPECIES: hypothetical protein [unclassified Mesorhizobium]MBZ9701736.1 hypothetical protein [Mesorhizobium sp. CO1-1-3]MBZ9949084.1 hypothetical protein [Mesorhizobium sp. BR1-1-11]TPI99705.1 hypothetical protein FJ428_22580 [Mesorhizobium sp. B2-8-1]